MSLETPVGIGITHSPGRNTRYRPNSRTDRFTTILNRIVELHVSTCERTPRLADVSCGIPHGRRFKMSRLSYQECATAYRVGASPKAKWTTVRIFVTGDCILISSTGLTSSDTMSHYLLYSSEAINLARWERYFDLSSGSSRRTRTPSC